MNTLTKATARQQVAKAIHELSGANIIEHDERAWASVSFRGSRHKLQLVFDGPDAVQRSEVFAALLPEHEFAFPDHLVADAYVSRHFATDRAHVSIELLLLEQPQ